MMDRFLLATALVATATPATLSAQAMVQPLGQTDADLLAAQMRRLAANPRDVQALATAGELSLRVGDLSGAAALFARADKVDPRSGRVKAGMASILVRSERPGEALRFFAQAESYGWPAARFAADRGLAYDLIGEQERAQRDYRLALKSGADDETARRYALSLGISGRQAPALAQLDPLVRRQDRAAWRARAFVLAMTGDTGGAAKIATTMMPAGMAQGLGAFFQRLPTLGAVDRAFAVHFGEIYATPERLADARLTPALAPLAPEPGVAPPVQVAAVVAPPRDRRDRRSRRERDRDRKLTAAVAKAAPKSAPARPAVSVAQAQPVVQPLPRAAPVSTPPASTAVRPAAPVALAAAPVAASPTAMRETNVRMAATTPVPPVAQAIVPTTVPAATTPSRVVTAAASSAAAPVASRVVGPLAPVSRAPAPAVAAAPARVAPVESAAATERTDSVLARIVASLSIPASELGVVGPQRPDPAPVPIPAAVERAPASPTGKRIEAEASAKEARDVTLRRTVAAKLTGDPEADEPVGRGARGRKALAATDTATKGKRGRKGAEDDAPLDPKAKRAADRKALADKKAAAEKKELADAAAAEKKAARARPARIWVQVAGGANEADLGKAWRAAKGKAPALAGKTGYSTPLRATNRVLTGPFKTEAEARALVNQLAKQGVSGFTFTSEAGQDIKKLGTR